VLDPFAGHGTTLVVADRRGRKALGIELLEDPADVIRRRVSHARVMTGDAREALGLVPPQVALCLTSPPYMTQTGHPQNPLTGYRTRDGDYKRYIVELSDLFRRVSALLRPEGHVVINVADPIGSNGPTPLVRDLQDAVAKHLTLLESIDVEWDNPPHGISQDVCLVFTNAAPKVP
jgi:DNA modification methylase